MFCENCGKQISNDAKFCEHCGQPIEGAVQTAPQAQPDAQIDQTPVSSGIRPGFSDKISHPSFREAMQKAARGTGIFAVLLILAPIVVAFVLSIKDDNFSYLGIGGAVSVIFLIFNLISATKKKSEKQWDGTVIDQQIRTVRNRNSEDPGGRHYTKYVTIFRDERGKTKKLTEGTTYNDAHPFYNYLAIGDRVRYHPEFSGFYEKYDKSHDTHIYCPVCGNWTAVTEDTCDNCGTVLLK